MGSDGRDYLPLSHNRLCKLCLLAAECIHFLPGCPGCVRPWLGRCPGCGARRPLCMCLCALTGGGIEDGGGVQELVHVCNRRGDRGGD